MSQTIELQRGRGVLKVTAAQRQAFAEWVRQETEEAFGARIPIEAGWRKSLQLYEAVAARKTRDFPIKNAPNLVVPLVATATETVYAQAYDLIFSADPLVTVRPSYGTADKGVSDFRKRAADILQRWLTHSSYRRYDVKTAAADTLLDVCQLGTGVYHIPFERRALKRRTRTITKQSPRIYSLPVEDLITPGGARSLGSALWIARRFYLTEEELQLQVQQGKWVRTENARPREVNEPMRTTREALGGTQKSGKASRELYEILEVFAQYDIDGDGLAEDIYAIYDRGSSEILRLKYTPYDVPPFEVATYQKRAHLIHGLGIADMLRQQQIAGTEILNFWILNMLLANCRFIVSQTGTLEEDVEVYPWMNLEVPDPSKIEFPSMADAYQSGPQAMSMIMGLSERRTGTSELSRISGGVGTRTPGITALQMAQQGNRRFATAFDSMRMATTNSVMQAVHRESEQLMAGNKGLAEEMRRVLGEEDALVLATALNDENFDEYYNVELTATDPSNSKEADRQNSIILLDRMMGYYKGILELSQLAASGQLPAQSLEVVNQIVSKGNELVANTLSTFDQIRDPARYLVEFQNEVEAQAGGPGAVGPGGIGALLAALGVQAGGAQEAAGAGGGVDNGVPA